METSVHTLSPEEMSELEVLYQEQSAALLRASQILIEKGMSSPDFIEADRAAGRMWLRIRELLGKSGQWTS